MKKFERKIKILGMGLKLRIEDKIAKNPKGGSRSIRNFYMHEFFRFGFGLGLIF